MFERSTFAVDIGMRTVMTLGVLIAFFAGADHAWADEALWRHPKRDGLNCLFVMLRCAGMSMAYNDFCGAVGTAPTAKIDDMVSACEQLGYKASARLMALDDLDRCAFPPICHLEASTGAGRYALYVGQTERQYLIFDGGPALVIPISHDEFRRQWTGVALVTDGRHNSGLFSLCLAVTLAVLSLTIVIRSAYSREKLVCPHGK